MELDGNPLHQDHIEKIIQFVPPTQLRSLSLASIHMRNLSSKPKLWKNMKVSKNMIGQEGLARLFSIKKFEKVRVIDMSRMTLTLEQLVENLNAISSSSVEELNLNHVGTDKVRIDNGIDQVPATLLGEVAGKLIKIDLDWTYPTPEQSLEVLKACATSTSMKELSMKGARLWAVSPQVLEEALTRLHKVNLRSCETTSDQCTAIFRACSSSTTMKELSLKGVPLSAVPPQLLEKAVTRLHKVDFGYCLAPSAQCTAILRACASSSTLNDVDLCMNKMSLVPADLLGRAVSNLAIVSLASARLNTGQCLAVMEACISSSKLINVDLSMNDLSGVPPQTLGEAAGCLQAIKLDFTGLTTERSLAVLQPCVASSQLTDLSMVYVNLREVPVDDLTQAVAHLRRFNLKGDRMTNLQKIGVLQAILASTCTVTMRFVQGEDVPAQVLQEARESGRLLPFLQRNYK